MTFGLEAAMSSPFQSTRPALGEDNPASRFSSVVFPEPFGPKMPMISPLLTAKDTSDTATSPPKRLVRFSTLRSMGAPPEEADDPAWHQQDHENENHAVDRDARFRWQFDQMRQRSEHQGAHNRPR